MLNKCCSNCNINKDINLFYKNKKSQDLYHCMCKDCSRIKLKLWKHKNKEKYTKQRHIYYMTNKEKIKYQTKIYREINKEDINERKRLYTFKNKEKAKEKSKKPNIRFKTGQRTALKRHIKWTLTFEDYSKLISNPCYYCNNILENVQNSMGIGLDRIDNNKNIGYCKENVVTSCKICNKIKNNFLSKEETTAAVKAILHIRNVRKH